MPEVETRQGALEDADERRPRRRHLEERMPGPDDRRSGPSYYDIPMLKPHAWTHEVTIYFFLGGLSVGAFVLSRLGERMGGEHFRDLTRAGAYVSAAAILPCAPLLIMDLGDPKRFHHMLRVFKPSSPMNLGTWVLTAFTPIVLLAALREALRGRRNTAGKIEDRFDALIALLLDVAGLPLGLLLATYTGVLISATAVPLWGLNPHLGSLFMTSGMNTGAAAVHLALEAQGKSGKNNPGLRKALDRIDLAAHVAEATDLYAFTRHAGPHAKPLTEGAQAATFWVGAVGLGLVIPVLLDAIPAPPKVKRVLKMASAAATLVGGFALRWAIMEAGKISGADPQAARDASRPKADCLKNVTPPRAGEPA